MTDRLAVVHDNNLRYEGKTLWADVLPIPYRGKNRDEYLAVSPTELETILRVSQGVIERSIEAFYHEQYARLTPKGYNVAPPSIWVAQLGSNEQTDTVNSVVYSEKGYENGGVHFDIDEQKPEFEQHWLAVERAGFHPHVRGSNNGAFLMLCNDEVR